MIAHPQALVAQHSNAETNRPRPKRRGHKSTRVKAAFDDKALQIDRHASVHARRWLEGYRRDSALAIRVGHDLLVRNSSGCSVVGENVGIIVRVTLPSASRGG